MYKTALVRCNGKRQSTSESCSICEVKLTQCLIKHQAFKAHDDVKVQLQALLTSALDKAKWSTSRFNPGVRKVKYPRYRPMWTRGVQQVKAPRFHDTRHMKMVRSSPVLTGRLYPPGISWYSFLEVESTPRTWTCRMLRKKSPVTRPGVDPGTFRLVAP